MQYTVAVLAALAAVASAQGSEMPAMDMDSTMAMGGQPMAMGGMKKFDNTTLSGQCNEIAFLTGFTKFANNDTQVQMAENLIPLTPEQVTQLKANATMAQTQLDTLNKNKTLADTCATVNEVTGTCKKFNGLMKLENFAQNDTEIAAFQQKKNLTDAQVTALKAFAAKESDTLDMMNNNITLVTQCMDLETNMKAGMSEADAALKASGSALTEDGTTQKAKSAASTTSISSFVAAACVAASIVLFA